MKIKYRNDTFRPNDSPWCIDCDIYKYDEIDTCARLCNKNEPFGGFNIINDFEVLEL